MAYTVTLIPGDGIGPEVTAATCQVLEASGVKFNWEIGEAGAGVVEKYGTPLPDSVIASVRKNKVALKGPVTTPIGTGFRSVNVALRKSLDLFCCFRPCKTYPGVPSLYKDVNIAVVRENTEDLYAGIEYERGTADALKMLKFIAETRGQTREDVGISLKLISEFGTRRIVKYAFDYARANNRTTVTAVHKANIMKFSDGLFLSVAREVAKGYNDIAFNDVIVDNLSMQLVRNPQQFDVLVLPNLYGDIISDLCAGLVGGLGVAPGANLGESLAIFEPTHGSAPKYAGKNKVNPIATMLSGMLMLRHLKEYEAADNLEQAISEVISEGKYVTYDMKTDKTGGVGTARVTEAIIQKLQAIH
jgi:isocitrate dehydrogenase (NAD+)